MTIRRKVAADDFPVPIRLGENTVVWDASGLRVEGKLADTTRGEDVYRLLKMTPRPAISGLSIGFVAKDFSLGTKPGEPHRTLKSVQLLEVSLVTFPSNDRARLTSVKSAVDAGELTPRMVENLLRSGGLPARFCKALIAGGWRASCGAAAKGWTITPRSSR